MNCPNCNATAGPDQRFCFECGTELGAACHNCGAALPPGAKFCGECGTPAAGEARARTPHTTTAERRLVSVLFADLVGFTATSESRDPEEVRDFLTRYTELASDTIARYGGTVDKFLGDGVMAIWGTPTAFEDDAERAVRAALDLTSDVQALGREFGVPELTMRAGIATGEAAVTVEGRSHGMVAGDLVNTASRLEGAAEPGTALVNDGTKRASDGAISYTDAGTVTLKGKSEKVSVWRPLQVMAKRGGEGRVAGLDPPFVGRASELHLIKELFKATTRDNRAHLVSIQGIPGIGKSRLVWEFDKYLDGLADTFYWHQGRSPAYGDGVTFWALGEMVRRRAGIAENDDDTTTVTRVGACVDEHIPEDDRAWVASALHALLGVGDPASMDRDELFAAWRQFFQRMALDQPVLMVFEDLQWADHGTIDFVESLLEWSRDYPILIITLSRPELLDRRGNWGAGQRGFTGLHLEALAAEEVEDLLDGMVPGMPESLKSQIIERSEGVPLYAVETVRMLLGEGHLVASGDTFELQREAQELAVPETLHALVAARLDTLDPEDRHLLQMGSVLGQTFTVKALADLAGLSPGEVEERLEPMVRREILAIESDPRSPERGQYRFVQGVIREVAYSGIAKTERSELHVRVAELMTELGDDELAGVIASHYMDAYQSLNERDRDEALKSRALTSLTDAAERAYLLGSYEQAHGLFDRALEIADDPELTGPISHRAGDSAFLAAMTDRAIQHFQKAVEVAEEAGLETLRLTATADLANALLMSARVVETIDLLERVSEEDTGEVTAEWVAIHSQRARAHAFNSDGGRAMDLIDRALKEAADLGLREVLADALVTKGWALGLVGRVMEATAVTEGALASAERHGFHRVAGRARNNIISYVGWDEPAWATQVGLVGYEEGTRLGNLDDRGTLGAKVMFTALASGDFDLVDRILDDLSDATLGYFARSQVLNLSAVRAAYDGRHDHAEALMQEAAELIRDSSSSQELVGQLQTRVELQFLADDIDGGLATIRDLLDMPGHLFQSWSIGVAIPAAVQARDGELIEEMRAMAGDMGYVSARFQATVMAIDAALASLRGEPEIALDKYSESAAAYRSLQLPLDLALRHLERLTLLGHDHDGTAYVAAEAREIWSARGVVPLLAKLDKVYPAT